MYWSTPNHLCRQLACEAGQVDRRRCRPIALRKLTAFIQAFKLITNAHPASKQATRTRLPLFGLRGAEPISNAAVLSVAYFRNAAERVLPAHRRHGQIPAVCAILDNNRLLALCGPPCPGKESPKGAEHGFPCEVHAHEIP